MPRMAYLSSWINLDPHNRESTAISISSTCDKPCNSSETGEGIVEFSVENFFLHFLNSNPFYPFNILNTHRCLMTLVLILKAMFHDKQYIEKQYTQ